MTEHSLTLKVKEILDWYDGPELFTATDPNGHEYLVYFSGVLPEGERYTLAKIKNGLDSVEEDLREFYLKSEEIFTFVLTRESSTIVAEKLEKLEEEHLPPSWIWRYEGT